jgi:hypothetical protein
MMIESNSDFCLFIAALVAAAWGFFRLMRPVVNRLTDWITKRRRKP